MLNGTTAHFGSPALPPRFWAKAEPSADGCWRWVGAIAASGYGTFTVEGKTQRAHRVAYTSLVGEIPEGLVIDHLCRVRQCVNPSHLEPVTGQVNLLRGETLAARQARQTHCKRGHAFDEENTRMTTRDRRECKTCALDRSKRNKRLAKARRLELAPPVGMRPERE